MKKIILIVILSIHFSSLYAQEDFSKLVPDILQATEGKFLMDGKFPGSCGGEGEKLDNGSANFLVGMHPADNYIFFSLTEHISNPKVNKREFRFFKENKFKGTPEYVLNEEGLSQAGVLKCSWNSKYSEDVLYGAFLKNCPIAKELLGYHSFGSPQGSIELCSVMNIVNFSVKGNEHIFQVKIGDALYYIDTTTMEELYRGRKFYSKEFLQVTEYKKKSDQRHDVAKLFTEIKSFPSFETLFQCAVKKDYKCLDSFQSKDFFENVASAGYEPLCNNGQHNNDRGPKCYESYKGFEGKISKVIYKYMIEVVDDIYNMKTEKYEMYKFDSSKKKFFRTIDNPHTDMDDAGMFLDFSTGTLIFSGFDDGLSC